jgi:hypothetical protein
MPPNRVDEGNNTGTSIMYHVEYHITDNAPSYRIKKMECAWDYSSWPIAVTLPLHQRRNGEQKSSGSAALRVHSWRENGKGLSAKRTSGPRKK